MQTIDFLPGHYRERRTQSRLRWWWATVIGLFGGVVMLASSLQWLEGGRIRAEVNRLETQVATLRQLDQHLLVIESKITTLSHHANLYTFLRHPWPRTRILAAIAEPLPAEVQLSSLRIVESPLVRSNTGSVEGESTAQSPPTAHPAVADLQQLCELQESQQVVVVIDGTTREVKRLHDYLEALGKRPLIAEARLNTLETRRVEAGTASQSKNGNAVLIVFQLQLKVKPGHGLSNGPLGPLVPRTESETANLIQESLR